jgi:hypothetical protein
VQGAAALAGACPSMPAVSPALLKIFEESNAVQGDKWWGGDSGAHAIRLALKPYTAWLPFFLVAKSFPLKMSS